MDKTIAIIQPSYLPWLGFFEQLYRSDVFVIYDDVQYDKHGWRNRNRIKTAQGIQWFTVPVCLEHSKMLIKDVKIDCRQNWGKKHLRTIEQNYSKAQHFHEYYHKMEKIINHGWVYLIELNMALIYWLAEELDIKRKIIFSSALNIHGDRIQRLIDICKRLGGNRFYEGNAGRNYINKEDFERQGIEVEFQNYIPAKYKQLHGEFVSHLSAIDLLFNEGGKSKEILISAK